MFYFSKSKYCQACQCPKMVWLNKFKPEMFDDSSINKNILEQGNKVGDLAMGLFGDFVEVQYNENRSQMLEETQNLLEKGTKIIAEASFNYVGLFCSVDILKNYGNKTVELYEVKSSTSVHDVYVNDIAYQVYVLTKLGFNVKKSCLVYINNQYVRQGEIDLNQLFKIEEIEISQLKLQEVENNLKYFEKYMEQTTEPERKISPACFNPYNCGFWGYCTKDLPTPNVFSVRGLAENKKFDFYNKSVISFDDLFKIRKLSKSQQLQIDFYVKNLAPKIDKNAIKNFLSGLTYPLYFLDFETFNPAIPPFNNTKPYEQIPFQYSLHFLENENSELKHVEFLAIAGEDPKEKLAERLCKDIPLNVCILAYNMSFEKNVIKQLAENYPDLNSHLMNIYSNIQDLMKPFQSKSYYVKEMEGSYSIKEVLPALFPNDETLNYSNLNGIHNGGEASSSYTMLSDMPQEEVEKIREQLLKYCELDTFAMVKIWQKLQEVIKI